MEIKQRLADYEKYCVKCKYCDLDAKMDPCNDCLAEVVNEDTERPIYFVPASQKKHGV